MISKGLLFAILTSGTGAFLTGCGDRPEDMPNFKNRAVDANDNDANSDIDGLEGSDSGNVDDLLEGGALKGGKKGGTPAPAPAPAPAPVPTPAPAPAPINSAAEEVKKKCTPIVEYVNDNSAGGLKLSQHVPNGALAIVQASQYVCSVLYKSASEVPGVIRVKLVLEAMDGVAYATGDATNKEIHISTTFIQGIGGDVKLEIDGVLIHETTHLWQQSGQGADGGLIEGVADYVRAGGGWYPAGQRNRLGGTYNEAYTTSAYFLGWVNSKFPDFVYKFNLSMKAYPGPSIFKTITGVDVDTLWNQYQSQGTFSPNVPEWVAPQIPLQLGK